MTLRLLYERHGPPLVGSNQFHLRVGDKSVCSNPVSD
jgi:hypothetical protein